MLIVGTIRVTSLSLFLMKPYFFLLTKNTAARVTGCIETQMPLSICWFHEEVNLKNFATLRLTWRYSKQAAVAKKHTHKEVCEYQSIFW